MRVRARSGGFVCYLLFSAGCASLATSPTDPTPPPPDPLREIREVVTDRPAVPGQEDLLPDVQLITFPYVRQGQIRRDTVRGAARVAVWLERTETRTANTPDPFQLNHGEILVCDAAVLERGRYGLGASSAPTFGSRSARDRRTYMAVWRPTGGDWRLAELYLSPGQGVRVGRLATGCRGTPTPRPRMAIGAGLGARPDPLRSAGRLWLRIGTRSSVFMTVEYGSGPAKGGQLFAITGEAPIGPLWLAAGPVVVTGTGEEEDPGISDPYGQPAATERFGGIGLLLRPLVRVPIGGNLRAVGSIGYGIFPDMIAKEVDAIVQGFVGIEVGL